jgi:hypothetical protein
MTLKVIEVVMIILTNRISNIHDICHIYVASFLYCKCVVHWNCGTIVQPPPLATNGDNRLAFSDVANVFDTARDATAHFRFHDKMVAGCRKCPFGGG